MHLDALVLLKTLTSPSSGDVAFLVRSFLYLAHLFETQSRSMLRGVEFVFVYILYKYHSN